MGRKSLTSRCHNASKLERTLGLLAVCAVSISCFAAQAKTTWQRVQFVDHEENEISCVDSVDSMHGWAVGTMDDNGTPSPVGLLTVDGATWTDMTLPQAGGPTGLARYLALAFADTQVGWMFGMKTTATGDAFYLWKSVNGGESWVEVFNPSEMIRQIVAVPPDLVFAVGERTILYSGASFYAEVEPQIPSGSTLRGIHMMNPDCGFTVAASDSAEPGSSAILYTSDGGRTWETRALDIPYVLRRLWFASADLGWAAGLVRSGQGSLGVLAHTADGGSTWTSSSPPDHPPMPMGPDTFPVTECLDIRFFDDTRGVALCLACTLDCDTDPTYLTVFLRTVDSGLTWQMDPDYEGAMAEAPGGEMTKYTGLVSMSFPNPNSGFLAGQNLMILRYLADEPEAPAWDPPTCGSNDNNGDGPGARALSGCGCRSSGTKGPPMLLFGFLLFLVTWKQGQRFWPGLSARRARGSRT